VTLAIAFLLLGGFVAVLLVDRHRKHHHAAVPIQRIDPDPPAASNPEPGPDPEPDPWPPTR
jgi:hypothetical protein